MIYGALAVAAVILLEAFPVYRVLTAEYHNHVLGALDYTVIVCCFSLALGVANGFDRMPAVGRSESDHGIRALSRIPYLGDKGIPC